MLILYFPKVLEQNHSLQCRVSHVLLKGPPLGTRPREATAKMRNKAKNRNKQTNKQQKKQLSDHLNFTELKSVLDTQLFAFQQAAQS